MKNEHVPAVSVVIPNYNHAPYLAQRLDTVLGQTFRDFEVIFLDDCSTDASLSVFEAYAADPRVRHVVRNPVNSGSPFLQWEKGIGLARGTYVWIAESDDWCVPEFLDTLMAAVRNHPDVVLAYAQSHVVLPDHSTGWVSEHPGSPCYLTGHSFVRSHLLCGNAVINASMAIFKRDAFPKVTAPFTAYRSCGDWLFWADVARQGTVFVAREALNFFRNHGADVSHRAFRSGLMHREELEVLAHFVEHGWISPADHSRALKSKYIRFHTEKQQMDPDAATAIEALLLAHPVVRANRPGFRLALQTHRGMSWLKTHLKQLLRS